MQFHFSKYRLVLGTVFLSLVGTLAYTQTEVRIRELTEVTADGISSDGAVWFGVDKTDVPASRKISLAELKKTGVSVANVDQLGAVGDGSTDDTDEIQDAIDTGRTVVGTAGKTYIVSSLTVGTAGQVIDFRGCTIKRKSATAGLMLRLQSDRCKVLGGKFDGNAANQTPVDPYGYACIAIEADYCEVAHVDCVDEDGIGIKGVQCQYANIHHNTIRNMGLYAVYIEDTVADAYGNKICDNDINVSSVTSARGIYITGNNDFTTSKQRDWTITGNVIGGDEATASDDSVGIVCRGSDGIVSNNHVNGFTIGISCDSTDRSIISGNRVENVNSSNKICYEVLGNHCAFTGNYARPKTDGYGIQMSGSATGTLDYTSICGNVFEKGSSGNLTAIDVQVQSGQTGKYISICGNTINTSYRGINLTRNCDGITISGNAIKGPGFATSGSRAVFMDEQSGGALITGNTCHGFQVIIGLYSNASLAYSAINVSGNHFGVDNPVPGNWVQVEGSGSFGVRCQILGNTNASDVYQLHYFDRMANRQVQISDTYGTPESNVTAGIGSIFINLNGGAATTVFVKESGTGNTGWNGLD